MLFDPKWEVEVKADPFSLENLVAWLEKKPATQVYCYTQAGGCLLAQWAKSIDPLAEVYEDADNSYSYLVHGKPMDLEAFDVVANGWTLTFGAALDRARRALARANS